MFVVSVVAGTIVTGSVAKVLVCDAAIADTVMVLKVLAIGVRPGVAIGMLAGMEVLVWAAVTIALGSAVPKRFEGCSKSDW